MFFSVLDAVSPQFAWLIGQVAIADLGPMAELALFVRLVGRSLSLARSKALQIIFRSIQAQHGRRFGAISPSLRWEIWLAVPGIVTLVSAGPAG